jgi:hypothetical protein
MPRAVCNLNQDRILDHWHTLQLVHNLQAEVLCQHAVNQTLHRAVSIRVVVHSGMRDRRWLPTTHHCVRENSNTTSSTTFPAACKIDKFTAVTSTLNACQQSKLQCYAKPCGARRSRRSIFAHSLPSELSISSAAHSTCKTSPL